MDTSKSVNETSNKIAEINDAFRRTMTGCTVTRGVLELKSLSNEIFIKVRDFDTFTIDNDPYDEHDFGSFEVCGHKLFWKIDYYDEALAGWCDPLSPECHRILTIMLADEY